MSARFVEELLQAVVRRLAQVVLVATEVRKNLKRCAGGGMISEADSLSWNRGHRKPLVRALLSLEDAERWTPQAWSLLCTDDTEDRDQASVVVTRASSGVLVAAAASLSAGDAVAGRGSAESYSSATDAGSSVALVAAGFARDFVDEKVS